MNLSAFAPGRWAALWVSCIGFALAASACSSPAPAKPKLTMAAAKAMFEERGVQTGDILSDQSVWTLDGKPTSLLAMQRQRPMLIVTCSLTCDISRDRHPEVERLAQQFGDNLAVLMLYSIEAHPKGDPCPYTGEEWVTPKTEQDGLLRRQPTTL